MVDVAVATSRRHAALSCLRRRSVSTGKSLDRPISTHRLVTAFTWHLADRVTFVATVYAITQDDTQIVEQRVSAGRAIGQFRKCSASTIALLCSSVQHEPPFTAMIEAVLCKTHLYFVDKTVRLCNLRKAHVFHFLCITL